MLWTLLVLRLRLIHARGKRVDNNSFVLQYYYTHKQGLFPWPYPNIDNATFSIYYEEFMRAAWAPNWTGPANEPAGSCTPCRIMCQGLRQCFHANSAPSPPLPQPSLFTGPYYSRIAASLPGNSSEATAQLFWPMWK